MLLCAISIRFLNQDEVVTSALIASSQVLERPQAPVPRAPVTPVTEKLPNSVIKSVTDIQKKKQEPSGVKPCPISRIASLTEAERNPEKGPRHMVSPPSGGPLHLVCCSTTKGPFNALVHENWAPLGAQRFLEMIRTGYFDSGVPLMRCIKGFLCQFGLNNKPQVSERYKKRIPDDPQWLPEGTQHRQNEQGVKRFPKGYLAYAGAGKNSRDNQLFVALENIPTLAEEAPWEVPWGELVGKISFDTFAKVHTGYGDHGPPQGRLWREGMTEDSRKEFPKLDYITGCYIADQVA
ncbi:PPIases accelerate the folding of proteins. It catalyzes the cis-trans isomerization of proline imidic peptide bonds in oligopeptides (By similarity) [Seminavis robusta]|uniref:PPIases accelerate the folding of proteins. It catalyzes the cis-trans isomerization of proline imidic peptide bonds in oligopeptides By similarity n=1 Tax=Seminavis robusta TaxID=568900 RepID=A0A9N8HBB2_9STRA|nr:PPIases accelerate the folding of proteins. It catalyzes the cis-trans isomerization of proline imidic peptide bonds in oligopeptides (By similarity) [Seminavis robusta]|eukprot:Sro330_g118950.1 PPIases accelerate the folding of proteins. It catalyzes the cis-trans isomerization of proline imidic peptide bonds in oligopeptides (By similarity) (293) ;mRNA; r:39371-40249